MKLLLKLLSEEVAIALLQLALIPTLYQARDLPTGTAQYIEHGLSISIDAYAVLALAFALYVVYRLFVGDELLVPLEFALISTPLLFFIGASAAYVASQHLSMSGLVALIVFYLYFLGRIILRALDARTQTA